MRCHWAVPAGILAAVAALGKAAPAEAEVRMEKMSWNGHAALRLSNGTVEVVVTTGIGPRVPRRHQPAP